MADIVELDAVPDTIEAELIYLANTGEKLVTQVADPGGRDQRQGGGNETHRVRIHNGRPLTGRFEFEREGFRFVESRTRVGNFYDEDEIRRVYYVECEELIKQVSSAKRVV
ncbi:MAG: methyltransferase, partial [Alphaproteobacteria bacterium]|nr:methyltransferase [Alphaproteobacteria bacterium]